jgi:hypothetical protein
MMNVQALAKTLAVVHTEIDSRAYWDSNSQQFLVSYLGGYKDVVARLADLDAFGRYVWVVDVTGDKDRLILVDL